MPKGSVRFSNDQEDDKTPVVDSDPEEAEETSYHKRPTFTPFQEAKKKRNTRQKWISALVGGVVAIALISFIASLSVHHIAMDQVQKMIVRKELELFKMIEGRITGEVEGQVGKAVKSLVMNSGYNDCLKKKVNHIDKRGHCYLRLDEEVTRQVAQKACGKNGGFLATHITNEFKPVLEVWGNEKGGWIGLRQIPNTANALENWVWEMPIGNISVQMDTIPWGEGKPSDHNGGNYVDEECGFLWNGWQIDDTRCTGPGYPICEYAPSNNLAAELA